MDTEELKELSSIENFEQWSDIDRYDPGPRYVPDQNKQKTGVIFMPLRREKPRPRSLRMYTLKQDGKPVLLRTRSSEDYEEECAIASFADRIFREGGAYVSTPLEVGAYSDDTRVYSLYSYFGGDNLARRLPELYVPQQHALGVEAGKQLAKLQKVTPTEDDAVEPVEDIFMLLTKLGEKGIKYNGFSQAENFMKNHSSIINGRPVTALHGDFSAHTLFLDSGLNVGILPLEEVHWGDPVRDLASLSDSCSLPFIKGVFKGLYEGAPPKNFFELLAYYSTERALLDIDTAEDEAQLATAIIRAEKLASDMDNYQSVVPIWY